MKELAYPSSVMCRALFLLCATVLLTACGPSVQHQKAEEALKRLQKVDAATTVGVTYVQYRQLLVDAQEAVNDMERADKPAPGRQEINDAMQTYTEAGQLWDRDVHHRPISTCDSDELKPLIAKYRLEVSEPYKGCSNTMFLTVDLGFQVWPEAKRQVNEAAKKIQSDQDTWSRIKASIPGLQ